MIALLLIIRAGVQDALVEALVAGAFGRDTESDAREAAHGWTGVWLYGAGELVFDGAVGEINAWQNRQAATVLAGLVDDAKPGFAFKACLLDIETDPSDAVEAVEFGYPRLSKKRKRKEKQE